ncbi:hypothetical protein G7Y89_g5988 [Cudoniella acicularis]|uniref:Uncharacterized protein n=1 Tax=Cudoniella acicularis TaxID=354080 RepID=A0A8H4W3A2_9HELO|nr:hypothetical protein G7Y89_g5988 [Cudoniella acicularis]
MDEGSPASAIASTSTGTPARSTPPTSDGETRAKAGRKNHWTPSRQRELARLYLYSSLKPQDIPKALKDEGWLPGKESTTKTVKSLLDHDPRWLRPKNREEMDKRIQALSEGKAQRKLRRNPSQGIEAFEPMIPITSAEFSETPLEDIVAFVSQEPLTFNQPSTFEDTPAELSFDGEDWEFAQASTQDSFDLGLNSNSSADEDNFNQTTLTMGIGASSLRRRLSQYSTTYVKAIARLLKTHSISDSSAASSAWPSYSASIHTADSSEESIRSSSLGSMLQKKPPVLASALLLLDRHIQRQGVCLPGLKAHDCKICWCAVADAAEETDVWVSRNGLLHSPDEYIEGCHSGRFFPDKFGNTILHVLAARDVDINGIVQVLAAGVDGNQKNTAKQSFLHVLPRRFLRTLAENDWNGLMLLLQQLKKFHIRFHDCDVFGRNFFHLLTRTGNILGRNELQVLNFLTIRFSPSRDAFGWVPAIETGGEIDLNMRYPHNPVHDPSAPNAPSFIGENSSATISYQPLVEENSRTLALLIDGSSGSTEAKSFVMKHKESFIIKHTRLVEIARIAFDVPTIEDPEGRNGLHCLAEASLSLSIDSDKIPFTSSNKRKRNQSSFNNSSMRLELRFELIQHLIYVGVELNSYDKQGNTVLMAFATNLLDGEDDKNVAKILQHLIHSGANVHWRNREGETALHIAVRLGRKVATQVLLENGANVHARTLEGKGVLAVGEMHYFRAKEDPPLYSSILACMAMAAQYGAQAAPNLVQEWFQPGGKLDLTYPFNVSGKSELF